MVIIIIISMNSTISMISRNILGAIAITISPIRTTTISIRTTIITIRTSLTVIIKLITITLINNPINPTTNHPSPNPTLTIHPPPITNPYTATHQTTPTATNRTSSTTHRAQFGSSTTSTPSSTTGGSPCCWTLC